MLPYMVFYLDGREARRPRLDIDINKVAEAVLAENKLRDVLHRIVHEELTITPKQKRRWLTENSGQVESVGCTEDEAWTAYITGVEDECVFTLESKVIDAMTSIVDEEDGPTLGGDDDDDDDDEEDDDDDEDPEEPESDK